MRTIEQQCIFAVGEPENGVTTVCFLLPEGAWEYMKSGLGHEFDMTKVGLPVRVVIGRCKSHADGMSMLNTSTETVDLRGMDMRIETDKKKVN